MRAHILILLTLLLPAACDAERSRLMREKYPSYPEAIKRAIDRNYLINGMDHDQVLLAMGHPICKKTITHQGRPVEVWLYPPGGKNPCNTAEFRVYFEQGAVTSWQAVRIPPEGG
jgi:outer membrane protein assembly factor BamE